MQLFSFTNTTGRIVHGAVKDFHLAYWYWASLGPFKGPSKIILPIKVHRLGYYVGYVYRVKNMNKGTYVPIFWVDKARQGSMSTYTDIHKLVNTG